MFYRNGYFVWLGTLSLPSIIKPKPVDKLRYEFIGQLVHFQQASCEAIASLSHDCVIEIAIASRWGTGT